MGINIGDKWNGWTVDSFIGEGSFGKVYKLIRTEFGYTYESALKVIRIPRSEDEVKTIRDTGMDEASVTAYFKGMVSELVSELAVMSKLKGYTNIVGYEDHSVVELEDEFGWEIYLRMELLTPFNTYAREHQFTEADAVQLGIDICKALEICHRANIIHRDIKPDNVFVSAHGEYKLGDFGIARQMEKTSAEMSKKGTVSYIAPEVYTGRPYDATVDTYSLGIMLYRLTNHFRLPFLPPYPEQIQFADTQAALQKRLSGEDMPAPDSAGAELAGVILKACAFDPADRYAGPAEMRKALEEIAEDALKERSLELTEEKDPSEEESPGTLNETVGMFPDGASEAGTELLPETDETDAADKTEYIPEAASYPETYGYEVDPSREERAAPVYGAPIPGILGGGRRLPVKLIVIVVAALVLSLVIASARGKKAEFAGYDIQYSGELAAGVEINEDSPFALYAKYADGRTEEATDWTVEDITLVEGDNTLHFTVDGASVTYVVQVPESSSPAESGTDDEEEAEEEDPDAYMRPIPEEGFAKKYPDGVYLDGDFTVTEGELMDAVQYKVRNFLGYESSEYKVHRTGCEFDGGDYYSDMRLSFIAVYSPYFDDGSIHVDEYPEYVKLRTYFSDGNGESEQIYNLATIGSQILATIFPEADDEWQDIEDRIRDACRSCSQAYAAGDGSFVDSYIEKTGNVYNIMIDKVVDLSGTIPGESGIVCKVRLEDKPDGSFRLELMIH